MNFQFLVLCSRYFFSAVERELEEPRSRIEYAPPSRSTAEKKTWLQYNKTKIQAPGTTFSIFRDKVRPEGGHEKSCRFGALTEVHQGAHIRSAKFWLDGNIWSYRQKKEMSPQVKKAADVLPFALLSGLLAISVLFRGQCNTGVILLRVSSLYF